MSPKEIILKSISCGQLEEAVAIWLQSVDSNDPVRLEVLGFSARLADIATEKNRGIINFTEALQARNGVMAAMLDTLRKWQPGGNFDLLEQAIRQLGISADTEISAIHLVNCNRDGQATVFRRFFNLWDGKSDFQFYFICGCPTEMPSSFSKRLIYEIIRDRLDDRQDGMSYPFQEDAVPPYAALIAEF